MIRIKEKHIENNQETDNSLVWLAVVIMFIFGVVFAYRIGYNNGQVDGYYKGAREEREWTETHQQAELEWLSESEMNAYVWRFEDGSEYRVSATKE